MTLNFSQNEIRAIGCLIEKQLATPDYYPMTENSLVLASNQKSSRDPVLSLSAEEVGSALGELSRKEFVEQVKVSGSRAFKFQQRLDLRWKISDSEGATERDVLAVIAVLALRGPQTLGQIRQRTERMFFFPDVDHVKGIIDSLMLETDERPALVREDHSIPGRDIRYTHLLGEYQVVSESEELVGDVIKREPSGSEALLARIEALEEKVSKLEALLD